MVIAAKRGTIAKFSVLLDGNELSRCESAKYLGITIESNLRWNLHIASLSKKLSQSAGIISKLRHFVNFETSKMLYHSFVKSHLLYGILSWGNDYKSAIQPLQILQNKILRLMFKIEPQSNVSNNYLYYSSKLLKIEDVLYKLEIAKFMYLYEHNKLPPLFNDYFLPLKKIHCHNTRSSSSNKYFLPFFSTNKAQSIINYTGVKIRSKMPDSLKKLSYKKFVLEYTQQLVANYG